MSQIGLLYLGLTLLVAEEKLDYVLSFFRNRQDLLKKLFSLFLKNLWFMADRNSFLCLMSLLLVFFIL